MRIRDYPFPFLVLLLIQAVFTSGCSVPTVLQNTIVTYPPWQVEPRPSRLFVANAHDVQSKSYRTNKEVQFLGLVEETMRATGTALGQEFLSPVTVVPGLSIPAYGQDSSLASLFEMHGATHGVIINHFDAYFVQTEVIVTETDDGKDREAFYDIVVDIGYSMMDRDNNRLDTIISARRQHSSRSVLSGLLAAGPSIVDNPEDALEGVHANVEMYLRCFFKGSDVRDRLLHVTKEFAAVGEAFMLSDYPAALAASEQIVSGDPSIAAKARYNCAVLLERMGDYERVKPYLQEALQLQPTLIEAQQMWRDYKFQLPAAE